MKAEFGFILNLLPFFLEQCPTPGTNMLMLISVASLKILQTVISDVEQEFFFLLNTLKSSGIMSQRVRDMTMCC